MKLTALTGEEARALAAPARQKIAHFLADAPDGATVDALTEHLDMHHSAVRKHLAQLVAAGLVVGEIERLAGRGRPRLRYRLASRARARHPYERLAVMLATVIASGDDPLEVGRRHASQGATSPEADPLDVLAARFAEDGFDPTVRRTRTKAEITLGRCPYESAALANPHLVCRLHLGLAEGIADAIGGIEVSRLDARDPRKAGCSVDVRLHSVDQAATANGQTAPTLSRSRASVPDPVHPRPGRRK